MALKNVVGLDHIVIVVRDLDAAAEHWRRLGFTEDSHFVYVELSIYAFE